MKKFLLSLFALLGVVSANAQTTADVSGYENAVYAEGGQYVAGQEFQLPIKIKNNIDAQACGFYVTLQEGLSFVPNAKDETAIAATLADASADHTIMSNISDGHVVLFSPTNSALSENLLYLHLIAAAPGEYTVTIHSLNASNADTKVEINETNSFVSKVVIVDYLTLDENSTTAPEAYTGDVLVKRSIKAGQWSTICLPFAIEDPVAVFGDGVELADFTDYEETYDEAEENVVSIAVHFATATAMEANHPYIIKVANPVTYEDGFKVENVTLEPSQDDAIVEYDNGLSGKRRVVYGTFYGTYVAETVVPANSLFISGNKFYYSTGATKMKAFRGYFDFVDELAEKVVASTVKMNIDVDGTTKIDGVHFVESAGAVYTIDGKFIGRDVDLKKLQKGIYVVDGKKVAVK